MSNRFDMLPSPGAKGHVGHAAGRWYQPIPDTVAAGIALVTGSVRMLPFILEESITISDLAALVTTLAAAGNFQLAIYGAHPVTRLPTGLVLARTANMSTAAAGLISADITGADVALPAGNYWMCINTDAAGAPAIFQTLPSSSTWYAFQLGSATPGNIASGAATSAICLTTPMAFNTWSDMTLAVFTEVLTLSCALVFYKVVSAP